MAAVPLVAGYDPSKAVPPATLVSGFHTAVIAAAGLVVGGAVLAFVFIRSDVLETPTPEGPAPEEEPEPYYHCSLGGPPLVVDSRS